MLGLLVICAGHAVSAANGEAKRPKARSQRAGEPPRLLVKLQGVFLATLVALHFIPVSKWVSE